MSDALLIQVPYHLGQEQVVLGAGPPHLAEAIGGETVVVERPGDFRNEVHSSFGVIRAGAEAVREAVEAGRMPVVLAGNCVSSVGTVAGLDREVGVVWFDAHADFHTPDSTPTGFFDGFGLSMLTGVGWAELRSTIPGVRTVPQERVVLAGTRDVEPTEEARLADSTIARVDAETLESALDELAKHVDAVYVHIDLDVLDPSEGKANDWAVDGGFTASELGSALSAIVSRLEVPAAAITAYDPRSDPEGRVPPIAARLVRLLTAEKVAS